MAFRKWGSIFLALAAHVSNITTLEVDSLMLADNISWPTSQAAILALDCESASKVSYSVGLNVDGSICTTLCFLRIFVNSLANSVLPELG